MSDRKKATSWIYTLKKEDLILELERRGLSIEVSFAVLRERLLGAKRDDEDGSDSGSNHQIRDSGIKTGPLGEASALTLDIGMADQGRFMQQTDGIASHDTSQPASRLNAVSQTEYGFSDLTLEERMDGEDEYNRRRHFRARPSGYELSGPTPFGDNPFYVDTRRRDVPLSCRDPPFRSGRIYGRESGVRFAMREKQDLDSPFKEEFYPTEPSELTHRAARYKDSRFRATFDPDFVYDTNAGPHVWDTAKVIVLRSHLTPRMRMRSCGNGIHSSLGHDGRTPTHFSPA